MTLGDGAEVSGRVDARCPGLPYRISYTGALERMDLRPETGTPSDLELIFRLTAQRMVATLEVQKTGDYESRTDFLKYTAVNPPSPAFASQIGT